jgi:hypothetical protein
MADYTIITHFILHFGESAREPVNLLCSFIASFLWFLKVTQVDRDSLLHH